jgi:hypothetical protein
MPSRAPLKSPWVDGRITSRRISCDLQCEAEHGVRVPGIELANRRVHFDGGILLSLTPQLIGATNESFYLGTRLNLLSLSGRCELLLQPSGF